MRNGGRGTEIGGDDLGSSWFASVPASLTMAIAINRARELQTFVLAGLLVALTLSVWVAIDAAIFDTASIAICSQSNFALESLCWYVPEFSSLWRPFVVPHSFRVNGRQQVFAAFCILVYICLAAPVARELASRLREIFKAADPIGRVKALRI
jgi:hypothetical protein